MNKLKKTKPNATSASSLGFGCFVAILAFSFISSGVAHGNDLTESEKSILQRSTERWAEVDVRTGVKAGFIPLSPPSNEALNTEAEHRWRVYSTSEKQESQVTSKADYYAAKLYWIEAYKKEYIRNLKRLIEANSRDKAPAF